MPVSASRLRLAGWSIIIGAVLLLMIPAIAYLMVPGQESEGLNPADVSGWRYASQLLSPLIALAATWIVLTTWKLIALAAKPSVVLKWIFDLLLIFMFISSFGGPLAVLGIIPNDFWIAVSTKAIMPLYIILGGALFFALGGIPDKAMPLVYPMRWTMVFTLVATIIITVMLIDINMITEAGPIALLFFAFLIIGLFAMVLFGVLLCIMFFKLARQTGQAQAKAEYQATVG